MNCSIRTSFSSVSALLRLALAASLVLLGGVAQAQTIQGPYPPTLTNGAVPTPYSWPTYHAGGANPLSLDPVQTLSFLPPNPLAAQQQGLPTGVATNGTNKYITEISSFVLGNYNPLLPPSKFGSLAFGPTDPGFPNHFRDDNFPGGILSWSAPFTFLQAPIVSTGAPIAGVVLADDSDMGGYTYPNDKTFPENWTVRATFTGGWSTQTDTNADVSGNPGNTTTAGYQRILAVNAKTPLQSGLATATYTFDVPTTDTPPITSTGAYSVDFHLPPPVQNENRINNAHYVITLQHPAGTAAVTLFDGRIDQTSTTQPRQHIAGPFGITAGDQVIVTLDNSSDPNKQTLPNPNTNVYVLADSVSLVEGLDSGTGATVQSSPTAISVDNFPEIADALYFGFQNTGRQTLTDPITGLPVTGAPTGVATGQKFDPNPYGNPTIGTSNADNTHRIRQLVYFGRTETIVLTNSTGGLVDANGNSTTVPVSETVGAVYCVDGITGSVVWRFQAPDVLDNSRPPHVLKPSAGISSAPAVARINVITSVPGATLVTYSTKLCVIAADDNGLVYCLDAIGNRNGTSNLGSNNDGTGMDSPVVPVYNQPIYNPGAALNTGATQDMGGTANHAHVGNTQVYWIYRPDPNASLNTNANQTVPHVTNPANDLPVPQAFGLASATIYVDPTVNTSSTTLAPASPPASDPVAKTSNAVVYIGNSNGTLYALDARGTPPTPDAQVLYNRSLNVGIKSAAFVIPAGEPTVTPNWWLPINHSQTNATDMTGNVSITSTPAILQTVPNYAAQTTRLQTPPGYSIYVTTANDDNNVGRLYAVSSVGPLVNGMTATPGVANYNANASAVWAFPDLKHNPLGSITGSPVVFTNPDDRSTNVYMAANVGIEYRGQGLDAPAIAGRIWAVHSELSGISDVNRAIWAYPDTFNPNDSAQTVTLGGTTITNPAANLPQPLGSFENATPAIGVVQFPTNIVYGTGTPQTAYTHTDNASVSPTAPNQRTSTNVLGQKVPMLYVGSRDAAQDSIGSTFYALDLDGNTTTQRDIFDFGQGTSGTPAPLGTVFTTDGFLSAPLLVTNATDTSNAASIGIGNGGAVFITGSDNNLYEVGATPTSGDANSTAPQLLPLFLRLPGFGSLSSPSAAAYNTADLVVTSSGGQLPSTARVVTEWVYGGDEIAGVARGITPANRPDSGGTIDYGTGGPPVDFNAPPIILPYHAHVYVFDNTSAHNAMSTDMSTANKIGASIAAFEWGTNAYLRVSNVVPPNPTNDPSRWVAAPGVNLSNLQPGDVFFSNANNSPVNINISDVDPRTGKPADTATYRSDASTGTSVFDTAMSISPAETNGFYPESGPGELDGNTAAAGSSTNGDMLIGASGKSWIGAATYSINPTINGKPDTPGARRRVIQATQKNIRVYQINRVTGKRDTISENTTIDVFTDSSQQTTTRDPSGAQKFQTIAKQQQPTFGVLNPIAVRGGGYPIQVSGATQQAIPIGDATNIPGGVPSLLGPFGGVHAALDNNNDLQALTNGNSIFVDPNAVPKSGIITNNTARRVHVDVITATSPIAHGTAGDNSDPKSATFAPAPSNQSAPYGTGSSSPPPPFGAYGLTIADRSALGVPPPTGAAQTLSNLKISAFGAQWNDNVGTGPAAVVNPLPWEDVTSIQKYPSNNGSLDYPDIPSSAIRQTLYSTRYGAQSISDTAVATPDPASGSAAALASRTVYPNPVQVQIRVPIYQPANLQIYYQTPPQMPTFASPAGPGDLNQNMNAFPMGYISRKRIYVDNGTGPNGRSKAYREILVYTGVPVDMTTTIVNQTTDLGKLPQSFGIQTDQYGNLNPPALGYGFMPYNPAYQNYFKPLTVLNQGNVNLLNVHFDQRQESYDAGAGTMAVPSPVLPLVSDALDSLSLLPSYDSSPVFTGPRANLPGTTSPANPFLVRTSLDTDLVDAYGRNSMLTAAYPGATFHKARPGDASPSLLTVPDVPRASSAATAGPPTLNASFVPQNAALPYIGLAVPLGTPVGTYSANVSVFEGMDPGGYADIYNKTPAGGGNLYKPLLPPTYGGKVVDGMTALTTTPTNSLYKVTVTGGTVYGQPVSTPTRLKATITETLVTNGNTYGNLPQVDTAGAGVASANFLPAAFRNAYWSNGALAGTGDLSLYWVTARGNKTPNTTPPYNIAGFNLPFTFDANNHTGYFNSLTPASRWFRPATANAGGLMFTNTLTAGVNTALSIAPDQHLYNGTSFSSDGTAFAFVTHLSGTAPYQNSLFCYPVTTGTGSLGTGVPVTTDTRQPRFGVRGLKFVTPSDFTDALGTNKVDNNLWAFWNNGSRGRSTLFYSSAQSTDLAGYTTPTPFNAPAALPLPAGLSSASDPSAVLVQDGTTDTTGASILAHMIEVTYTGVGADGNADIYVSRYRPYFTRNANRGIRTDLNGHNAVSLALVGGPSITEQLMPDGARQYYQARDVAWARNARLDVQVAGATNGTPPATNSVLLDANNKPVNPVYDPASGFLVYNGVSSPAYIAAGGTEQITAVYVDLARGRVRFRTSYTKTGATAPSLYDLPLPGNASVTATFQSQARRITTDSRADTEPVSFIDEAFKANEGNINGAYSAAAGRAKTDRYWFIWRKSAAPGTSTTPTLYTKTQRLTAALLDSYGKPISVTLDSNGAVPPVYTPHVTSVKINGQTVFTQAAGSQNEGADIDWARGRIYFPLVVNGMSTEGQQAMVVCSYTDSAGMPQNNQTLTVPVYWLDEQRLNDPANAPANANLAAVDTTEHAVPIDIATNEGSVSAFLDPFAYADVASGAYDPYGSDTANNHADQLHKVWLFWNSTRNGTADIYYETIAPRFSVKP